MQFSDKTYNLLKWMITIVLPAVATAIITLGHIFNWGPAETIAQCITVVQTLLGAIFCIGNANYYKGQAEGQITAAANTDTEHIEG